MDPAASGYDTDKDGGYMARYERAFAPLRDQPVRLLELGVLTGGSLRLWADFFPCGEIVGLDLNQVDVSHPRVRTFQGSQSDAALLSRIVAECAPDGFDVVIDDASHLGEHSANSFIALYERHLKPGGIYVLEDWGTGYWKSWPDGSRCRTEVGAWTAAARSGPRRVAGRALLGLMVATRAVPKVHRPLARLHHRITQPGAASFESHTAGMVGLVKQIVDLTSKLEDPREVACSAPRVAEMWISDGQVFCFKPRTDPHRP